MVRDESSVAVQAVGIMYDHCIRCGFVYLNSLLVRKPEKLFP